MRARTRFVMLPAIQFDGQANRRRIEIEDATAHDVLAKKANAIDPPSFRRGKQSITPFLRKGEDKHNASRSFTPFGTKGGTRSVGGMPSPPYARDTAPSRTCTRTATSD